MKKLLLLTIFCGLCGGLMAQTGADTLHFRKVYYFGGTGLALPLGKTKKALSTRLYREYGLGYIVEEPDVLFAAYLVFNELQIRSALSGFQIQSHRRKRTSLHVCAQLIRRDA